MKKRILPGLFACFFLFLGLAGAPVFGQLSDSDGLAMDIPEPPGATQELPTPIPMIYEFVGGLMAGDQDKCLSNFDVATFLGLIFGKPLKRLNASEYQELFAYQVQSQRNEFRFLSRIMHRLAKDCKFKYSNPRYHQQVQAKVVVNMSTHKGAYEFIVYCRYADDKWKVYDYILSGKRYVDTFKAGLAGMKLDTYIASMRPFYDETGFRAVKNPEYGIQIMMPNGFKVREKVSQSLLASISALDGQFLLHIQGAIYPQPHTLSQVANEIKESIMPFKPRMYDQWKTDIAGVDIGNVLFQFEKNGKNLFTHMVIVPMREKLVVLNFYHSSLQLMKHFTTLRDKILESLRLTKIEAAGGMLPPAEDTSLPGGGQSTANLPTANPGGRVEPEIPPPGPGDTGFTDGGEEYPPETGGGDPGIAPPPPPPPPPPPDDNGDGTGDGDDPGVTGGDDVPPPPPPPPPDDSGDGGDDAGVSSGDENPPPPPPPPPPPEEGGDDAPPPDEGGGTDVSF